MSLSSEDIDKDCPFTLAASKEETDRQIMHACRFISKRGDKITTECHVGVRNERERHRKIRNYLHAKAFLSRI